MLVCWLELTCATGGGISDWAVMVTVIGSCVIVKLYRGKSLSVHLISVLLA